MEKIKIKMNNKFFKWLLTIGGVLFFITALFDLTPTRFGYSSEYFVYMILFFIMSGIFSILQRLEEIKVRGL